MSSGYLYLHIIKVGKKAKIRNWYITIKYHTWGQDTVLESDKYTRKYHIQESQEVIPFPAGDQKAARHWQDNIAKK